MDDLVLQGVGAIIGSRTFRLAVRQRAFLQHVVKETLRGRSDLLKEYSIAIAVFGKDPSFDPRLSSIVRTEARKLRKRLAKYYATEGRSDPIRIELPVGRYAPVFHKPAEPPPAVGVDSPVAQVGPSTSPTELTPARRREPALRVLVLPFENRSAIKRDQVLSDGLTDELSHALSQAPDLEVVARTSAFQFKDRLVDVSEIAHRLNVEAIIEGSVRPSGKEIRILAQVDDERGRIVWSAWFTRSRSDIFEIAPLLEGVTAGLNSLIRRPETASVHPGQTGPSKAIDADEKAYQDYLQGLYLWNRHTLADFAEAIRYFKRATERDTRFTRAYLNLAYAYIMLPVLSTSLPSEFLPKAYAAAARALELDPRAGEAHIAMALSLIQECRWDEAGEEFRKGLELSPSDAFGRAWYGMYLATIGRSEEALQEQQHALQLEPASPVTAYCYGQTLYLLRRYTQAAHYFRSALALDPNLPRAHAGLGLTSLQQRNYARAIAELERAVALTPGLGRVKADLGYAYAVAGDTDKATGMLNEFLKDFRPASFPAAMIAQIYIGLGETDQALEWLHQAVDQNDLVPFLTCDPLFDPLRRNPRFVELLKRTNLI